ncbi:uncharacterized protein Hap1MRO34_004365 [Clarias gariepinus]
MQFTRTSLQRHYINQQVHTTKDVQKCEVVRSFTARGSSTVKMITGSNVLRIFIRVFGNILGVETDIINRLKSRLPLHEVSSEEECDVIIAFVPIVSRAGTDIEAALKRIQTGRPVVLVVLHHTFDTDYFAPNSKYSVNREGVLAVDLLFFEDIGVLRNVRNDEALKLITEYLMSKTTSTDLPHDSTNRSRPCPWWFWSVIAIVLVIFLAAITSLFVLHYYLGKL